MPRSRRRKGVVKGKTRFQVKCARKARQKKAKAARRARPAPQTPILDDKYANYPSNRPMPHPGAPR